MSKGILDYLTTIDEILIDQTEVIKQLRDAFLFVGKAKPEVKVIPLDSKYWGLQPEKTAYTIKEFDLSSARTNHQISVVGDQIGAATDGELDGIYIRLNNTNNDAIPLEHFNPYYTPVGFSYIYLTNSAQAGKTLYLHISTGAQSVATPRQITTLTDITALSVGTVSVDIVAQAVGKIGISIVSTDITGQIPISLNIAHLTGNIPIDIAAQTVANLNVNLAAVAATLNVNADIVAQTVGNIGIDLAAQSIGNIDVALAASNVVMDFNIKAQAVVLNMKFSDQSAGVMSQTDWATKSAYDMHLQGKTASLASGAEITLITLTLLATTEHWLYTIHVSGDHSGLGKVRANKTSGYDELAYGYFGANGGYIKDWLAPVKRKKDTDAGITEITVTVKNNGDEAGNFAATLDGLRVVDITAGDATYDTKIQWQACATQHQVDLTTSEGDVILA